ncbi:MAG: response regulator transcription factor [Deferribacteres bacterium]|nr:response regulator transcription factor [Deferribacteres bacterium]
MLDNTPIKCAIVDDEKLARDLLQDLIQAEKDLQISGVFRATSALKDFLETVQIDVLFLDIQMPGQTGIDFLKQAEIAPKVVFTTAYAEYAVDGFDLAAFDYLVKPITEERFKKCIKKLRQVLLTERKAEAYELVANKNDAGFFYLKSGATEYKIAYNEILLLEAAGEYIKYTTQNKKYLVLGSLKKIAEILPSSMFLQVHRSYIVPIAEIKGRDHYNLILKNNLVVPIGKTYRKEVIRQLFST